MTENTCKDCADKDKQIQELAELLAFYADKAGCDGAEAITVAEWIERTNNKCSFAGCTEARANGEKYCNECLKALRTN
jgi:hypothetical protein